MNKLLPPSIVFLLLQDIFRAFYPAVKQVIIIIIRPPHLCSLAGFRASSLVCDAFF